MWPAALLDTICFLCRILDSGPYDKQLMISGHNYRFVRIFLIVTFPS